MIDPRIVRFIGRHHVLTLATVAGEQPYCSHAFYAYDPERNLLVFAADKTTRHAEEMQAKRQVALRIALQSKTVGKLQGLQLCGTVREADEEARKTYIRRFPFAALAELTLWVVEISYMKFTDNTLGFGKKLIWNSKEQE